MDIARQPKSKRNKILYAVGGVIVLIGITAALATLKPAAPSVEGGTLMIDSVRRGPLIIQVRGPGTLVPEQIRWVTAVTAGRVERRLAEPGPKVTPETVLMVLTNPDVQLEALESERQLTQAQSERVNVQVNLESQRLNQQSVVATTRADYNEAQRQAVVADSLAKGNMISRIEATRLHEKAAELSTRLHAEEERLALYTSVVDSQLALQRAQVARLRAVTQFQRDRVRSMEVKAGAEGVVQELPLEVGQWAQSGATLAKVVQPGRLKAVLRIPDTQAKDVAIGQPSAIDTRNGIIPGHVVRIDPASQGGTVTVDVALDGPLPRGARPDLSVDGTIEIAHLTDVLFTGRPAYGQANSTAEIFRLTDGGKYAERVKVQLGRTSVNAVEILGGLKPGDRVIVSDLSRFDAVDRIRIN